MHEFQFQFIYLPQKNIVTQYIAKMIVIKLG